MSNDSGDLRAIVRLSLEPAAAGQELGGLAWTFSQVAAGGGVVLDLSEDVLLVATKAILNKRSPLFHQVAVGSDDNVSFLVELVQRKRLPRKLSFLRRQMAAYRSEQPPAPPPLPPQAAQADLLPQGPAAAVFVSAGPLPRLHSQSAAGEGGWRWAGPSTHAATTGIPSTPPPPCTPAAGTNGGAASMAAKGKNAVGKFVAAVERGKKGGPIGGKNAWANNPEGKAADALKGGERAAGGCGLGLAAAGCRVAPNSVSPPALAALHCSPAGRRLGLGQEGGRHGKAL